MSDEPKPDKKQSQKTGGWFVTTRLEGESIVIGKIQIQIGRAAGGCVRLAIQAGGEKILLVERRVKGH